MAGGTHFADWSRRRDADAAGPSAGARHRLGWQVAVLVALYAVCSFTGDRIGEALGNREHDLAEGVRDVWLAGWFLTGPTTRRTVVVVALAALPVSLSLAYLF